MKLIKTLFNDDTILRVVQVNGDGTVDVTFDVETVEPQRQDVTDPFEVLCQSVSIQSMQCGDFVELIRNPCTGNTYVRKCKSGAVPPESADALRERLIAEFERLVSHWEQAAKSLVHTSYLTTTGEGHKRVAKTFREAIGIVRGM